MPSHTATDRPQSHIAQRKDKLIGTLDFFPTPPWATRAYLRECFGDHDARNVRSRCAVWDPCCGAGHMIEVLKEGFELSLGSDIYDYGKNFALGAYVEPRADVGNARLISWTELAGPRRLDWVIFNPPFNLLVEFLERALLEANEGVAMLAPTRCLEGGDRYTRIFRDRPPTYMHQFAERVPMTKGYWHPSTTTTTAYAWFTWRKVAGTFVPAHHWGQQLRWIPPGAKERHTRPDDKARFAISDEAFAAIQADKLKRKSVGSFGADRYRERDHGDDGGV